MKHSFHPDAIEEYLGAVSYYADIGPRLAESFIHAIESGIDPNFFPIVEDPELETVFVLPFSHFANIECA